MGTRCSTSTLHLYQLQSTTGFVTLHRTRAAQKSVRFLIGPSGRGQEKPRAELNFARPNPQRKSHKMTSTLLAFVCR